MSKLLVRQNLADVARLVEPPHRPTTVDRTFELPPRLYALTVGAYLGFLAILATTFATGGLLIPMAICVILLAMGFGVPAAWTRLQPDHPRPALRWTDFRRRGLVIHTGRITAGEATAQVLVLPILILGWGVAVAVIAALV